MELTKEQIQRVNKYLDVKGVKFIDFRIEIFDHIISQIEQKLEIENTDFETVFYQVTDKWNKQLNETTSFLFGLMYPAPKVVINKAKRIFQKYLLLSYFPLIIIFLIVINTKIELNKAFGYLTIITSFIFFIISIIYTYKIFKSRAKTVYSFIIKTQYLNFIIMPMIIISNSIYDLFNVGFLIYLIIVTYYSRLFYKKHQKEKEKYKLLVG